MSAEPTGEGCSGADLGKAGLEAEKSYLQSSTLTHHTHSHILTHHRDPALLLVSLPHLPTELYYLLPCCCSASPTFPQNCIINNPSGEHPLLSDISLFCPLSKQHRPKAHLGFSMLQPLLSWNLVCRPGWS